MVKVFGPKGYDPVGLDPKSGLVVEDPVGVLKSDDAEDTAGLAFEAIFDASTNL